MVILKIDPSARHISSQCSDGIFCSSYVSECSKGFSLLKGSLFLWSLKVGTTKRSVSERI